MRKNEREEKDLPTALAEAFQSADPTIAWYLDREQRRVVSVKGGVASDEELDPAEIEEDEERFAEVPPILEAEIHGWMEEFVEERADAKVAAMYDHRAGANARFLKRLEMRDPAALAAWKTFLAARVAARVGEWLAEIGAAQG